MGGILIHHGDTEKNNAKCKIKNAKEEPGS
jgi:hypothetical protein